MIDSHPATESSPLATSAGRRLDLLLLLFLAIAAGANYWVVRGYVFEDAYITFRYAANLAAGHGFVFQPGERVLGSSTPLWTLLLAACGALGADIPAAGRGIFCLCLSACGYFGWRLLARRGAPLAGAVFAVAAVFGAGGILPFAGMETALHLALLFLAFLLAGGERPWRLGVVLGLLCLDRYDGVLAAAAVLVVLWLRRRRLPWREAIPAGGLFGAWLLFAQLYFGSPLPNTLAAKAADVRFFDYLTAAFLQQARQILLPLHWLWPGTLKADFLLPALAIAAVPIVLWFVRSRPSPARLLRSGDPGLAAAALGGLLLWLGYAWIGPPLAHTWYLIPAGYCALYLALAAWGKLPWPRRPAYGLAALLLAVALLLLPALKQSQAAAMASVAFGVDRIGAYRDMAAWVTRHGLQGTTVLTLEPGYLTYLSGQRAIDAAGLVSPGIYFHGPAGRRQDFAALVDRFRPEMVVPSASLLAADPAAHGYLSILTPLPGRQLWLRRDVYLEHFEALYDAWQRGAYSPGPALPGHPLAIDFAEAEPPFFLRRARLQKVRGLTLASGEPWRQRVLNSRGASGEAAGWSEEFLIDFDQLEFLFAGSHPAATSARLYVDGLLAWERGGHDSGAAGPEALAPLERVAVPVNSWRGHRARLAFASADAASHFFAADRIRSRRWQRQWVLGDFEAGAYDPALWAETFGAAPADNRQLARLGGLTLAQGRGAASSLGLEGPRRMCSRPFVVEHGRLALSVFDFGDARTRVELAAADRAVVVFQGGATGKIVLLDQDLGAFRGQNAVLCIYDEDPAEGGGIGIDSLVLHDPARSGDSP